MLSLQPARQEDFHQVAVILLQPPRPLVHQSAGDAEGLADEGGEALDEHGAHKGADEHLGMPVEGAATGACRIGIKPGRHVLRGAQEGVQLGRSVGNGGGSPLDPIAQPCRLPRRRRGFEGVENRIGQRVAQASVTGEAVSQRRIQQLRLGQARAIGMRNTGHLHLWGPGCTGRVTNARPWPKGKQDIKTSLCL
jgi:hypothetical protein